MLTYFKEINKIKEDGQPDKTVEQCVVLHENPNTAKGFDNEWGEMKERGEGSRRKDFQAQSASRFSEGVVSLKEEVPGVLQTELDKGCEDRNIQPVKMEELHGVGIGSLTLEDIGNVGTLNPAVS
jgi:hypothetical protein